MRTVLPFTDKISVSAFKKRSTFDVSGHRSDQLEPYSLSR
jgi:hypothetical protein